MIRFVCVGEDVGRLLCKLMVQSLTLVEIMELVSYYPSLYLSMK